MAVLSNVLPAHFFGEIVDGVFQQACKVCTYFYKQHVMQQQMSAAMSTAFAVSRHQGLYLLQVHRFLGRLEIAGSFTIHISLC